MVVHEQHFKCDPTALENLVTNMRSKKKGARLAGTSAQGVEFLVNV